MLRFARHWFWASFQKRPNNRPIVVAACLSTALLWFALPSHAEGYDYDPRTTFGEIGLLEIPSARMAPDGQIAFSAGILNRTQRYNSSFQILPWFEASFRYSHLDGYHNDSHYYDRSFGLKMRLFEETEVWPEVSVGSRDLLGTGIYSAEYVVASKRIGTFDLTGGLGWGRFADNATFDNPLAQIFPSFKTRQSFSGQGGVPSFGQLFHGRKIGAFGGILWRTPIDQLYVMAEYSSDRYLGERFYHAFNWKMPINIGVSYRAWNFLTISAGYFYGTTYGVTATVSGDPTSSPSLRIGPEVPRALVRSPMDQARALTEIVNHRTAQRSLDSGTAAWVTLPEVTSPQVMSVSQALHSEARGVRDVDVMNKTVLVDAHIEGDADRACYQYAQVAAYARDKYDSIALTDSADPSGRVSFCRIARAATPSVSDSTLPIATTISPALNNDAGQAIRDAIARQNLVVEALDIGTSELWVYFSNPSYQFDAEATGRVARILMAAAPPSVELFHVVPVRFGLPMRDITYVRSALERVATAFGTPSEVGEALSLAAAPMENPILSRELSGTYPRLHWNIGPAMRQSVFDPISAFQIDIQAALNATLELAPGLEIAGRAEGDLFNTFVLVRRSDSLLPHVRSDAVEYYRHGLNGISNLYVAYRQRLSRDVYAKVRVGYLEDMYAGGGAEILWRPDGERFAVGADIYQVWQRNFDRLFGFRDYHVLTGHVSLYYQSPWHELNFNIHAGRYLAGDYGATFELTRRFTTGVEIGAFVTLTNVPFAQYGEGSFDKGIIVKIPLQWGLPIYTTSSYDLYLHQLTRDGGQRLANDDSLYEDTRAASYPEMLGHNDSLISP